MLLRETNQARIKYTINSNVLYIFEKKKILHTSNGGGQMIVWPPEFPVWVGPWPLGPPTPPGYATASGQKNIIFF